MSTRFDDCLATIILITLLHHVMYQYKCTLRHVLSYEDLYKHFGCSLPTDKDLINNLAKFKILEMTQILISCQALSHQGIPSA